MSKELIGRQWGLALVTADFGQVVTLAEMSRQVLAAVLLSAEGTGVLFAIIKRTHPLQKSGGAKSFGLWIISRFEHGDSVNTVARRGGVYLRVRRLE